MRDLQLELNKMFGAMQDLIDMRFTDVEKRLSALEGKPPETEPPLLSQVLDVPPKSPVAFVPKKEETLDDLVAADLAKDEEK